MRQIYSIGVIIVGILTRELRRQAIFGHMPVPWCIMCGLWKTINKQAFYDSITHHRERRAWKCEVEGTRAQSALSRTPECTTRHS